jgi:hypothetical protein
VFGAVFIAVFAGFIAGLHILDPLALAMGAGVGSGSLMAAASGAIAAQQTPEVATDVATFAAASNLITTTIGTYFTLFLSLPFTVWAYGRLEPILGRGRLAAPASTAPAPTAHGAVELGVVAIVVGLLLIGFYGLIGNRLNYGTPLDMTTLGGMAIILVVVLVGYALYRLTARKLPVVLFVSLIGMGLTYPASSHAAVITELTGRVNFLALATPILAFAGLAIAKDVPVFRRLGWRIVLVSLLANAGTFLGASLIAQLLLRHPG